MEILHFGSSGRMVALACKSVLVLHAFGITGFKASGDVKPRRRVTHAMTFTRRERKDFETTKLSAHGKEKLTQMWCFTKILSKISLKRMRQETKRTFAVIKLIPVTGLHHHECHESFILSLCYSGYPCLERGFVSVSVSKADWPC